MHPDGQHPLDVSGPARPGDHGDVGALFGIDPGQQ